MDANKLKVLQEIGYEIKKCCGLCANFLGVPHNIFGDCYKHTYEHKKHIPNLKPLSVSHYGVCASFSFSREKERQLHKFTDLMEG